MTRGNRFLFSVVVPTYERPEALRQCLSRLAPKGQSIDTSYYEVLVSDDSRDARTREMIRAEFDWVKWIAGPRRGPAANRNCGAHASDGEWLVFTDDDCLPEFDWLQSYREAIEDVCTVLEGKTVCRAGLPNLLYEAPVNENGGCLWSCNFAIQRELFFGIGQFDERFPYASGEDEEFRERLRRSRVNIKYVPEAVVDHPPRRRPVGRGWHKRWKSQVLKEAILGKTIYGDRWMPLRIAKARLVELREAPTISDAFKMIKSALMEVLDVARHLRLWKAWAKMEAAKGCRHEMPTRSTIPNAIRN